MRFRSVSICPGIAVEVALIERHAGRIAEQHPPRELVPDDLHRRLEDLIAVRVIEVEVRVDDRASPACW